MLYITYQQPRYPLLLKPSAFPRDRDGNGVEVGVYPSLEVADEANTVAVKGAVRAVRPTKSVRLSH